MSIADKVKISLEKLGKDNKSAALIAAERMADQFAEIKPIPFIVPIERFAGLPFESKISKTTAS